MKLRMYEACTVQLLYITQNILYSFSIYSLSKASCVCFFSTTIIRPHTLYPSGVLKLREYFSLHTHSRVSRFIHTLLLIDYGRSSLFGGVFGVPFESFNRIIIKIFFKNLKKNSLGIS